MRTSLRTSGSRVREPTRAVLALAAALALAARTPVDAGPAAESAPELAARCSHAVTGVVESLASYWDADGAKIYTDVTIRVIEDFKGDLVLTNGMLTITELGGAVAGMTLEVQYAPRFVVGETVLLFIEGAPDGRLIVCGRERGKLTLRAAPGTAFDRNGLPQGPAGEPYGTIVKPDPADDPVTRTREFFISFGFVPVILDEERARDLEQPRGAAPASEWEAVLTPEELARKAELARPQAPPVETPFVSPEAELSPADAELKALLESTPIPDEELIGPQLLETPPSAADQELKMRLAAEDGSLAPAEFVPQPEAELSPADRLLKEQLASGVIQVPVESPDLNFETELTPEEQALKTALAAAPRDAEAADARASGGERDGQCLTSYGCSNFNENFPVGTFSTTSSSWSTISSFVYGGDYAYYSVVQYAQYEWTLCPADSASAPYDSQLTLWNQAGTTRYCYSDDYCGDDAKIQWTATFTGTVRVLVSQYDCVSNTTESTLRWRRSLPPTHCNACGTADYGPFTPGTSWGTHSSSVEAGGAAADCRWYRFNVTQGRVYDFTVCAGGGAYSGDPEMWLYNSSCVLVTSNDDSCTLGPALNWTATYTGAAYVKLASHNANAATWTIAYRYVPQCTACATYQYGPYTPTTSWTTHSAAVLAGGSAEQCKWYRFNVTQGRAYDFTVCAGGGAYSGDPEMWLYNSSCVLVTSNDDSCSIGPALNWTATYTGAAYLRLASHNASAATWTLAYRYVAQCTACPTYQYGPYTPTTSWTTHASSVLAGGSAEQCKWYRFSLPAAGEYTFTMCAGGGAFTGDPEMWLHDSGCVLISSNDDTCGLGSAIAYTASSATTVYLKVASHNNNAATWTLAYTYTPGCLACPSYDFGPYTPSTSWTTHSSSVSSGGSSNWCRWYRFSLTAGRKYTFTMCAGGGTFTGDPEMWLYGSGCGLITSNDDSCGLGSQIVYEATATTSVYLKIGSHNNNAVSWTLAYRYEAGCLTCPTYNFGPYVPNTGWGTHSSSAASSDFCKWYRFDLTNGRRYRFTMCAGGGTYTGDPIMWLYDSGCSLITSNDDTCSYGSAIIWTATYTGAAYLKISSLNANPATWTLAWTYGGQQIGVILPANAPAGVGSAGPTGSLITITGSDFGLKGANDHVEFLYQGSQYVHDDAYIASWTDTAITCYVPAGASSGDVYVNKDGAWSNGVPFVVDWCYGGHKWPPAAMEIPYRINANGTADVAGTAEFDAIHAGLQVWEDIPSCYVGYDYQGTTALTATNLDGENVVSWTTAGWSHGANVLAVSTWWWYAGGDIVETDMEFNDQDFTWSVGPMTGQYDVQNVAAHEAGHGFVGLLDLYGAADYDKTMFGYVAPAETQKRSLEPQDIAGAAWIYGCTNPAAPTGVAASDASFCDLVRVSWDAAGGATSYKVYRSLSEVGCSGAPLGTPSASPFDDTTATPGVTYYYSVAATNDCGDSACSATDAGDADDCSALVGDCDCDGFVTFYDIDPFVLALSGEQAYLDQYPGCRWLNADADCNGTVDFIDIDPFVGCIQIGGCVCP